VSYTKAVKCIPRLGKDGWYRVEIDTYYHTGSAFTLVELAEKATGVEWDTFGCFMDSCCIATKENTGTFTIEIGWMVKE